MSSHCLLVPIVSAERALVSLIGTSLSVSKRNSLLLAAFKFLFLFLTFKIFTIMYVDVDLSVYFTWSSLSFLDVPTSLFHQIWEVFSYYFLICFLTLSPLPVSFMCMIL